MYSLSRESEKPRERAPEPEPKKEDAAAVEQFNAHIMLTVRAVNNLRSVFVVRGS